MEVVNRILRVALLLALVVTIAVWIPRSRSGLNGTWIKRSGDRTIPNEITIRAADNEFRERWFGHGGLLTIVVRCDGAEHDWSSSPGIETTYHAQFDRKTLVITKHIQSRGSRIARDGTGPMPGEAYVVVERWAVSENGHELVVTGDHPETIFDRRPFLAALFYSTP
jgi:hypothetical protein